jgi:Uma2 family endonuclease
MSSVLIPVEQRFVLCCMSWPDYARLSDLLGERHIRATYDGKRMELMTLSPEHERAKKLLARLVEALTEELDIAVASFGSMTCRREDLDQGLEPDECYWLEHEPQVRGRTAIDLAKDPPPGLVVEVEISRSILNRIDLYAGLGVPEVWRWNGQTLRVCLLQADGIYTEGMNSRAFPAISMAKVERFLRDGQRLREAELLRNFRKWVRQQAARKAKRASRPRGKKKRSS